MRYYLWYSECSAKIYGTWWYQLIDGTNIELTAIALSGDKYEWPDKKLICVCSENAFSFSHRGQEMNIEPWLFEVHKLGISQYIKNKGMISQKYE